MTEQGGEKGEKGDDGPLKVGQASVFAASLSPGRGVSAVSIPNPDLDAFRMKPSMARRLAFRFEAFADRLAEDWQRDGEEQNARFLWLVSALALGAAGYFSLPDEPNLLFLMMTTLALGLVALRQAVRGGRVFPILLICMAVFGCSAAAFQSHLFTTPVLEEERSAQIVGRLERVERRASGDERWTIDVESIERLAAEKTPKKVLLVRKSIGGDYHAGERLGLHARLTPPQRPAYPGGFDYGRYLWSRSIGAQGYMGRRVERLPVVASSGFAAIWEQGGAMIERARSAVADYIAQRMDGEAAGLAIALSVGKRDQLTETVETDLRRSGLAHILAISGLHMGLVAMSVFWGMRVVLSLIPQLALNYPIKEWAAGVALACAAAYLVLSGASVATIRAFFMTAIFLLAIIAGRSALTMHNLALALMVLVLLQPYAVIKAGMQMSFAATAALIACYERLTTRRRASQREGGEVSPARDRGRVLGAAFSLSRGTGKWIFGIGLTSLIASFAVLPFSIAHFQQVAPLGLIANLLVMPIISLIVMPLGLLSLVFVPMGLQSLPLAGVQWGLEQVIALAGLVSGYSDLDLVVVPAGGAFLLPAVLALMVFAIHRRLLAALAIVPAIAAVILWSAGGTGDFWISETGRRIAVRGDDQRWQLVGSNRMVLEFSALLRADGDVRAAMARNAGARDLLHTEEGKSLAEACDGQACVITDLRTADGAKTGLSAAVIKHPAAFAEECSKRDIIISKLPIPQGCGKPRVTLGRDALERHGSALVSFQPLPSSDQWEDVGSSDQAQGDPIAKKLPRTPANDQTAPLAASGRITDDAALPKAWSLTMRFAIPEGKRPWHRSP